MTQPSRPPRPPWTGPLLVVAVLTAASVLTVVTGGVVERAVVPAAALVLLAVALGLGLSWADLGLSPAHLRSGARYGLAAAALTVAVIALAAALPATRDAFADDRYHLGLGAGLRTAFVVVPLLTVLPEELAFRGVLFGTVSRGLGERTATIVSSVAFGLWHVASSWGLATANAGVGQHLGTGTSARVLSVLGAVATTTVAGFVFCWLRRRSGSLVAPIALHWAVNGGAVLAAAAVWAGR